MNVYVTEVARRLAQRDIEVDIYTRATASSQPAEAPIAPGVNVRHIVSGPFEGLAKDDLPGQLCVFAREVLRTEAQFDVGHYDVVHSHYWLSGQVGALARDRWGVPLVHSMHTMAKVKNDLLAEGDTPEPQVRVIGEEQVVAAADMLIANTVDEAKDLINSYDADPARVEVVHPGVDLDAFRPVPMLDARARLGLPLDSEVLLFVGRIQPLKAPDILLRAAGRAPAPRPLAPLAARGRGRRRSVGLRPRAPDRSRGPRRRRSASQTWCGSSHRYAATSWSTGTPLRRWCACRRTTRASAWWPSRPRLSARRWSRLRSGA